MIARVTFVLLLSTVIVACGKRGPPLAPLHLVPDAVIDVVARRTGETMRFRFQLPTTNLNGPGPVALDRVEIYALTMPAGAAPPPNRFLLSDTARIGIVEVKPLPVEGEPPVASAPNDTRPLPGEMAEFVETLTPDALTPSTMPGLAAATAPPASPPAPSTTTPPAAVAPATTPAAPAAPTYAVRVYIIRGMTKSGRPGQPSARLQLPLTDPPPPPTAVEGGFTETSVTLKWAGPSLAEGASAEFNVYTPGSAVPINAAPLGATSFEQASPAFGLEQCFVVTTVTSVANVSIESDASAPACVTPKDVFAPAAPQRLQVVPAPGVMNLSWQPNTEADLAGYIVLRGDAPGGTLQALTPAPITATRFEDTTARAGSRYVYVVVAVDRTTPRNTSAFSNRVEETAR